MVYRIKERDIMNKNAETYRLGALSFFDQLDKDYAYDVAMGISNLGYANEPESDDIIACVTLRVDEPISKFKLHINSTKFQEFTGEQAAGVVWHELNHILHKHLQMSHNSDTLGMSNKKILTMAQEIVCNDTVLYHNVELPHMDTIIHGEKYLGRNTYPLNTKDVYDELMKAYPEDDADAQEKLDELSGGQVGEDGSCEGCSGGIIIHTGEDAFGDSAGVGSADSEDSDSDGAGSAGSDDGTDEVTEALDLAGKSLEDVLEEATEKAVEGTSHDKDPDAQSQNGTPNSRGGHGYSSDNNSKIALKVEDAIGSSREWLEFLKEVDPRIDLKRMFADSQGMSKFTKYESDWLRKPSYMHSLERNSGIGRLPAMRPARDPHGNGNEMKPNIIFAIDQSGSIDDKYARAVLSLASTIPEKKVNVKICVYAGDHKEISVEDLKNKNLSWGSIGYGTEFSAIDAFVKSTGFDYNNTTIINFTDGESNFGCGHPTNLNNYVFVDVFADTPDSRAFNYCKKKKSKYRWLKANVKEYRIYDVFPEFRNNVR